MGPADIQKRAIINQVAIVCQTCLGQMWVCDAGPDLDTPCPDCNRGLEKSGPDYDRHEAVASDTALPQDVSKTTN